MDIKNINSEKIKSIFKDNEEIKNHIIHNIYEHYLDEVGIQTILNFLKVEDGMNFKIQHGLTEPGVVDFSKPEFNNPDESEIEKIIRKNKIPYTQEQIQTRIIQYFLRRLAANIPNDKILETKSDVINFIKGYEMAFLYDYLIPIAKKAVAENKIRKNINKLIKEALVTVHAKRQFEERFLGQRLMAVGFETTPGQYEEVGVYKINDLIIDELQKRFDILSKKSFPINKDYAVKVLDININPNDINYFEPENKPAYLKQKNPFILLNDSVHDSNGNSVYVIIRHGEIVTTMLVKNYVKIDPNKMRVDFIIKDWDLIVQNKVR